MSKGATTRQAIISRALNQAGTDGLEGLTIGSLAGALGMSKSGLFAHFRSKEQLQLQVLQEAVQRFIAMVVVPAIKEPRGEARVRALFENWVAWSQAQPGGCLIYASSIELDDKPGVLRDFLEQAHRDLRKTIYRAVDIAVEEGHFRPDLDRKQFAFEFTAIAMGYLHAARMLRDGDARARALMSFERRLVQART